MNPTTPPDFGGSAEPRRPMSCASGGGFGRSRRPGPSATTTQIAAMTAATRPRFAQRTRLSTSMTSNNPASEPDAPDERNATYLPLSSAALAATATREYELVLMLDPEAPDERRDQIVSEARSRIEGAGTIKHDTAWGMRQLAFEIRQRTEADYRFFRFESSPPLLESLDHDLKIADGVLRFRIFSVDPRSPVVAPPAPTPGGTAPRAPRSEDGGPAPAEAEGAPAAEAPPVDTEAAPADAEPPAPAAAEPEAPAEPEEPPAPPEEPPAAPEEPTS